MRSHSTLARLEQGISVLLWSAALDWLAWHASTSPLLAVCAAVAIVLPHSLFLAYEFVALRFINRDEPVPQPTSGQLVRAWLAETVIGARLFYWHQPFRWRAVPDHLGDGRTSQVGHRGVVFIHGFVCNRGFWTPWLTRMRANGRCFVAVNLEPVFGSIDEYIPIIEQAVQQVMQVTRLPPVLVCHSMGGLVARAWLRAMSADSRVHHVITIGSPHRGTWWSSFIGLKSGRQMRLQSPWLRALDEGTEASLGPGFSRFTCWYSNCDNVVLPASAATLPGARNRLVLGKAHVELAFDDQVMSTSLAQIMAA